MYRVHCVLSEESLSIHHGEVGSQSKYLRATFHLKESLDLWESDATALDRCDSHFNSGIFGRPEMSEYRERWAVSTFYHMQKNVFFVSRPGIVVNSEN